MFFLLLLVVSVFFNTLVTFFPCFYALFVACDVVSPGEVEIHQCLLLVPMNSFTTFYLPLSIHVCYDVS